MGEILAYARRGREFAVMDELARLGVNHWRGVRIEFERRGKNRIAEPYEYPALPCYIWMDTERYYEVCRIPDMCRTFLHLTARTSASFQRFRAECEERKQQAQRIILNREAIMEYQRGERIEIRDGVLVGQIARFEAMIQRSSDLHPKIRAEVDVMGRSTIIEVDPLSVRRAV